MINYWPDSQSPQWSRQAVITVSRSTWDSKVKRSRHQYFLFRCDWTPEMFIFL